MTFDIFSIRYKFKQKSFQNQFISKSIYYLCYFIMIILKIYLPKKVITDCEIQNL